MYKSVLQYRSAADTAEGDLDALFTRIGRGDPVQLNMQSGTVFVITGKQRR
ncbi:MULTISPECIES: hypothetical protein [unclassified Rhizobium]|uniref:hypothetical protein n=1 Tax=unclassified Rhizobium TaxID=2613769 RepID=UPI0015968031|nr:MULTISPECIES: hypothetical protein [unclassified Rhizobium]MDK4733602.1 hypothetical protein [Rhizobium sp. CNPSo 3490]